MMMSHEFCRLSSYFVFLFFLLFWLDNCKWPFWNSTIPTDDISCLCFLSDSQSYLSRYYFYWCSVVSRCLFVFYFNSMNSFKNHLCVLAHYIALSLDSAIGALWAFFLGGVIFPWFFVMFLFWHWCAHIWRGRDVFSAFYRCLVGK